MSEAIYGYCPTCGSPGTMRARDMVGTTCCKNGHEWVPEKTGPSWGKFVAVQHKINLPAPMRDRRATNLNEYAAQSRNDNDKWWHDPTTGEPLPGRNKGELFMLMVTELAEGFEGIRKNLMDDKLPHRKMEEVELADALIRIFDYAGEHGLDLEGAYQEKRAYNWTRQDHSHEARRAEGGKAF